MSESAPVGEAVSGNGPSDKEFSCDDCGKSYKTHGGLIYHVRNTDCGDITCPECGIYFPSRKGLKTHYGTTHDGSLVFEESVCDNCGVEFTYNPNETVGKFCCNECCLEYRETRRKTKTCETCGGEYTPIPARYEESKFCSQGCYAKYSSRIQRGENHHNWKGGGWAYYGGNWNQKRRECLNRDNHTCQDCGTTESLHVHHIQPLRTFDEPEEANNLKNLVTLCETCHLSKWEGIPLRPDTR